MNIKYPLLAALCLFLNACSGGSTGAEAEEPPLAGAAIGGDLKLTDENGAPFDDATLAGRYRIIYFGYSYCPDVCPVDLQNLMQGLKMAEKDRPELAEKVQPLFVTIDPERDTPEAIKAYTANFHPRLIGLTGTAEQIAQAAGDYLIIYQKQEVEGMTDYLVDHSRQAYLLGPEGEPIAILSYDKDARTVADEILKWTS